LKAVSPEDLREAIDAGMPVLQQNLTGIDFNGFDLRNSIFLECDLSGRDFSNALLDDAMWTMCDITNCRLGNAPRTKMMLVLLTPASSCVAVWKMYLSQTQR